MGNNSVVTQDKLQEFYNTKVYPYLNGSANLGFTPIGTVISVMSNEAPENYLVCDGTTYNISEYSDLANFFEDQFGSKNYFGGNGTTTFAVPDLRGEFLRGTGTNSHTNQGNGANVGIHQNGTSQATIFAANSTKLYVRKETEAQNSYPSNIDSITTVGAYDGSVTITNASITGSFASTYTSRPTNTSVLYCIAYKNIYISTGIGGYPVEVTNPTDGQIVTFDATNQKWVNGGHKYSTSEHVVGTWIDGKPVYEKTIIPDLSNISVPSDLTIRQTINIVNISDLNIDEGISITGGIIANKSSNGILWPLATRQDDSTDYDRYYFVHFGLNYLAITFRGDNYFIQALNNYPNSKLIATIRYTKTTD